MQLTITSRWIAVPAVVLALAGLAGCGDGSGGSAGTGDGSTTPTTSGSADAATKLMDVCKAVSTDDVGVALGGVTVTADADPSSASGNGCTYNQEDLRALGVAISAAPVIEGNGGIEGAKTGTAAVISGSAEDIDGVGDAAFVVVGKVAGGDNDQAQGVVQVGSQLITVFVQQGNGLPTEQVKKAAVDVLTLVASKA
ncbi:MAG: hypothetical protein JWR35_515 [Marmoricola sp.]|nr:hypothetical protein [Marmoricola sp.]